MFRQVFKCGEEKKSTSQINQSDVKRERKRRKRSSRREHVEKEHPNMMNQFETLEIRRRSPSPDSMQRDDGVPDMKVSLHNNNTGYAQTRKMSDKEMLRNQKYESKLESVCGPLNADEMKEFGMESKSMDDCLDNKLSNKRLVCFKAFDVKNLPPDPLIGVIAKRRSGKSTMIASMIKELNPEMLYILVKTKEGYEEYVNAGIPREYIHQTYNPTYVENMMAHVEKKRRLIKKYCRQNNLCFETQKSLLMKSFWGVIDDFGYDKSVMNCSKLIELAQNGRHNRVPMIIALQNLSSLNMEIRGQLDCVCILREFSHKALQRLHEQYAGMVGTLRVFKYMVSQFCRNYGVMVLNLTSQTPDLEDFITYYKATITGPKQIGHKKYREVAKRLKRARKKKRKAEKLKRKEEKRQQRRRKRLEQIVLKNHTKNAPFVLELEH